MAEPRDWRSEPISALALSVRAQLSVESTRVATIGELCDLTENEFLVSRGFGETTLRETRARLAELGLRFRDPSEPPQHQRRAFRPPRDPKLGDKLNWSLAALELSVRACNTLEAAGLVTVRQIVARSGEELLELPGIDAGMVAEVSGRLAERGLHLGMKLPANRGD
jgi:DNA-directed RNA polymerase alpha subunit